MKLNFFNNFKCIYKKMFYNLGIRQILMLVFGVLSLLTISAMSWNTLQIISRYNDAERMANINTISQLILELNNKLARERGFTATLLANRSLYNDEEKNFFLRLRKDSMTGLTVLHNELERHSGMNKINNVINKLDGITKQFLKNRQQADNYLNYQQESFNYKQWIIDVTQRIEEVIELHNMLLTTISEEGHILQYGMLIKDILFTFSENAGLERALISTVISQKRAFTESEYKLLEAYKYTTQLTARRLAGVMKLFPETPSLLQAKEKVNKIYLKDYQKLRSAIVTGSQANQKYSIDSIEWFEQATQAINVIISLSEAVNQHFNQHLNSLKSLVFKTITNLIVTVLIVISIFFISFLMIYYRILSPLKKLENSAHLISKGDFTQPVPAMVNDEFGKVAAAFEAMRDYLLTDKIRKEAIEQELLKLSTAIEQSISSIIITNADGVTEYVNPQFYRTSGYDVDDVIGKKFNVVRSEKTREPVFKELWTTIKKGRVWQKELLNRKKNGELYWVLISISPVRNKDGQISHFISIQHDITEHKSLEKRLNYMAYHDELTALPNRFLLADRYRQVTLEANRTNEKVAMLLLDLDKFKLINDNLGHHIGDQVLVEISKRLKSALRDSDTISRYGGDEFIILANSFSNISAIFDLIKRIDNVFLEVVTIAGQKLHITSSVGISIWPDDGKEMEILLSKADTAMYHAKEMGRGCFQFYTNQLNVQSRQRLRMENDLRDAIDNKDFELYYQPQIHMNSGKIIGIEALIRWNHEELGMISPLEFIPLAEESNLIKPIGEWVLQTACAQAKKWQDMGYCDLMVAVNLSARQLDDKHFIRNLKRILELNKNKASCLEIEITETSVMASPDKMHDVLNEIKSLGVKLAMDDFGTGFSSLSYLRRFPFDKIKIDRSFIAEITCNTEDAAIVKSIIELSHSLNKRVVAEGVETIAQARQVESFFCDEIQGYLISKPITVEQCEKMFLAKDFIYDTGINPA